MMAEKRDMSLVRETNKYGDGVSWMRGPLLGKGSFGRVYKAVLRDGRSKYSCFASEMAVKPAEVSVSATIQKEKEILNNLTAGCPYIIHCYGEETTMGVNGALAYNLLLEYGSGGTLDDRIKKSGCNGLPELEARIHTRSILRGLNHIHGLGYVHCDLKPGNILLVPKGRANNNNNNNKGLLMRAKIGDFGVAKRVRKVEPRCWRGTLMYLSPETVVDYIQETPSDVWALGCVVLEMLTGKSPWEGTKEEIVRRIGTEGGIPEIPSRVSEQARHFLMCCFERKPMNRFTCELLLGHPFVQDLEIDDLEESEDSSDDHSMEPVSDQSEDEFSDGSIDSSWSDQEDTDTDNA